MPAVYFIEDLVRELRISRSTIERARRHGAFPLPELETLDRRPRWSKAAVERYLAGERAGRRLQKVG